MQERLNIKVLVWLLSAAVLVGGGGYLVYRYQIRRNAPRLLELATGAEEKGRFDRAARFVGQYLTFAPHDTEARLRYGLLLDKQARTPKAQLQVIGVLDQVLLDQPQNHDLRRRLIALAMQLRRYEDARLHLQALLKYFPEDAAIEFQLGFCQESLGEYERAADLYRAALKHAPDQVDTSLRLANILRIRLNQVKEADQTMDGLLAANPQSAASYLARAGYRRSFNLPGADDDVQAAQKLAPDDLEVLLAVEAVARAKGNLDEARRLLQRAIDKYPMEPRLYTSWASLEQEAGRSPEAVAWLRRGLAEFPADRHLHFNLASVLIYTRDLDEAETVINQMIRLKLAPAEIELLRARLLMQQGDWVQASQLLESARPLLTDTPELVIQADLRLAECYARLGAVDRQLASLRQACTVDPQDPLAPAELASALFRLGRLDEALEQYRRLMNLPRVPSDGWTVIARLQLLRTLRQLPERRRWEPVDQALQKAAKVSPESIEVPILQAEFLFAQDQREAARKLLEATRDKHPKALDPWLALAALADREAKPQEVQRLLDAAQKQLGPQVDLLLARLRFVRTADDLAALQALEKVASNLKASTEDQARLVQGLAATYSRLGQDSQARRLWQRAAELLPQDLQVRAWLFDLAAQSGQSELMEQAIEEIKRVEGADGPMGNFAEASRLISMARKGDKQLLRQARERLGQVASSRPAWARVPLALADIDELEAQADRAVDDYLRAIELGERRPSLIRRVAELLYERQRYAEADQVIRKFLEQTPESNELQKLAAEISLRTLNTSRALQLAQQAVPPASKDYRDHIWLGRVLWTVGRRDEAEAAFRRALLLADTERDTWTALIQYYVVLGQKEKAESTLRDAEKKLAGDSARLALAHCYEIVGRADRAEEEYQKAVTAQPGNPAVLRATANFYLATSQPAKAIPFLRRIMEPQRNAAAVDLAWARRRLALSLAMGGKALDFQEALRLAEQSQPGASVEPEDLDVKARVLATHPGRYKEAILILEELNRQQPLTAAQQYFLARLYEATGNWPSAREQFLGALAKEGDNPLFLAGLTNGLLRQKELLDAELWLDRWQQRQPDSFEAIAAGARLLSLKGRYDQAAAQILGFVTRSEAEPKERARRQKLSGQQLDGLGLEFVSARGTFFAAAEKLLRQATAESKDPECVLLLAQVLGRQNRVDEGLALCENVLLTAPTEVVAAAALNVVGGLPPDDPRLNRVAQWLDTGLAKKPASGTLLNFLLALLRERQGRFADAANLYRKVLQSDPQHSLALNSLAQLLALQGDKSGEALILVQKALDVAGPNPSFLDTRATVQMTLGRYDLALEDLKIAVAEAASPTRYFHLALAYQQSNQRDEAVDALDKAKTSGLQVTRLHLLERDTCTKMLQELAKN